MHNYFMPMKKNLLIVLLGIVPFISQAEIVTESQAEATASRFFNGATSKYSRANNLPLKLVWNGLPKSSRTTNNDIPAFYVFNRGKDQGFVIVSGEDAIRPILGYSEKGSFGVEGMPANLREWMKHLNRKVAEVRRQELQPTEKVRKAWNLPTIAQTVVNLETPNWDQTSPYSDKTPYKYYTGCTITATAIVMGYHQWPDCGVGQLRGYTSNGIDVPAVTLGHPYHWKKMPYLNGNGLNWIDEEQADAVSTLMRDLGVMGKASYSWDGTSADPSIMAIKLPRHMKYKESIMHLKHDFFSEEVWLQMMKSEIDAQRPILYAGYNFNSGHAFVLDGYDTDGLFSVNWGWGGMSNGYFELTSLTPNNQGAGGSTSGYNADQEAVIRILPNRPGNTFEHFEKMTFVIHSVSGSNAKMGLQITDIGQGIQQGSTIVISAGAFVNLGTDIFEGNMKLAITDATGRIKKELYTTPGKRVMSPGAITMPLDELRDFCKVTLEDPIANGDRIRLLYLSKEGQWLPVTCDEPDGQWEIILKQSDIPPVNINLETISGNNLGNRALVSFSAEVQTSPSVEGVEAFYAELKNESTIVLKKIESQDERLIIPANTGVILATVGNSTFSMQPSTGISINVPVSNLLHPTTAQGSLINGTENAYLLTRRESNVLFQSIGNNDKKIAANSSYLILPPYIKERHLRIVFDEMTGIGQANIENESYAPTYDLSGRRVNGIMKGGIYIKNGKKIIVK